MGYKIFFEKFVRPSPPPPAPSYILNVRSLSAEKMYSINFTESNKNLCLSLHYHEAKSYLFVNGKEIHKFKAKDSDIVATSLCLGNISKY